MTTPSALAATARQTATVRGACAEEHAIFVGIAEQHGVALHRPRTIDRAEPRVRVATLDGEVAGFACIGPSCAAAACAESTLVFVFVFERRRERGIGRLLVESVCTDLDAVGQRALTFVAQPWAEGFFCRVGARRAGGRPPGSGASWSRPILTIELSG